MPDPAARKGVLSAAFDFHETSEADLNSAVTFTKYQFLNKLLTELNSSKMLYGILLDTKPVPLTCFQDRQPHLIVEL